MNKEAFIESGGCPYAALLRAGQSSQERAPIGPVHEQAPIPRVHGKAPMIRVVVGDRVKNQVDDERVVSVAEAEKLLAAPSHDAPVTLHFGQGTDYESVRRMYHSRNGGGVPSGVSLVPSQLPPKASRQATHKHVESNILISQARANGNGTYSAQLLIDDRCADMSDHLTGEHVPGMAIAEAARQMIIAVAEEFFIAKGRRNQLRFVTHQMDIEYFDFLLPLAVELRYVPISLRRAGDENMKLACEVHFIQSGNIAATARFTYSTINRSYLESRESAKLEQMLSKICD